MPCQITIRSVNGIVPIGAAAGQPTRVRATGMVVQCPGGVLLTLRNDVTGASFTTTTPALPDGNGRFLIDEPFPAGFTLACGDQMTATIACAANAGCTDVLSEPLRCCDLQIRDVQGFVPPGSLAPTALLVTGTLFGFVNNTVDLTTTPAVTTPVTGVVADQRTGLFTATLPLISPPPGGMPVMCGATWVKVDAQTSAPWPAGCSDSWARPVSCPQCFRAQIAPPTVGPCAGNPPTAQVTFDAQIALPANGTGQFEWVHSDGATTAFSITIAAGAPGAFTSAPQEQHPYPPGTHTVEIRRTDVSECPPVQYTFTVTCAGCPKVTGSVVVGPCVTTPGPTKDHRPVMYTFDFTPPLGNQTATGTLFYGGPDAAGATQQSVTFTGPGPYTVPPVFLKQRAGGYSSNASLLIQAANGAIVCMPPLVAVNFSLPPGGMPPLVNVDSCLPCPTAVTATEVTAPMPPLAAGHRQFRADVTWAPPAPPPPPPSPVFYDWTLTLPNGRQATISNGPAVVTTEAHPPSWSWSGPASVGGAVDLAQLNAPGNYSVGVVAKYAVTAGLPTDPATGVSTCVLNGATGWNVPGPTPPATPPPPPTRPPKVSSPACDFLLIAAVVLHIIGAIVLMIGLCLENWIVILVGAGILTLAWLLFGLWVWLCAATTPCSLLYTVFCILFWLVAVVVPVALVIGGIIAIFQQKWPCFIGALLLGLDWGLLLTWFTYAMVTIAGCPYINCFAKRPAPGP